MTRRTVHAARARPDELPQLARLMADSPLLQRYAVTYDSALAALQAALQAGDVLLAGRLGPEQPVQGLAWLVFAPRVLNHAAYLRLLVVAEPAQGKGLGAHLLGAVEEPARQGANHLYLLVTTDNLRARRLYAAAGFRHVGDLPELIRPGIDEALYHKRLRGHAEPLA